MRNHKKTTKKLSRREFLGGTVTAATVLGSCSVVPRHVLGGPRQTPPSEKLNIAGIGIGGQGKGDMENCRRHNIVALCDVDWRKAAETFKQFPDAKRYKDFRKMLDKQKEIDAVVIATPDHTHAVAAMWAIKMGKHVYCEKPLTHSVYESRKLAEAAREANVATQMGNGGQAGDGVRDLSEWVWDGAIGPVREVHVWTNRPIWPQGIERPKQVHPVPDSLDWDLWLGPAPDRPYNRIYHPFRWRGWWDFGTGALGDMGCHAFHPIFKVLKLEHPTSVGASSTAVFEDTFPSGSVVNYQFPARGDMPPLKLTWYDGGLKPRRPDELEGELGEGGTLYVGDNGKILDGSLIPASRMQEYQPPPKTLPRSIGHFQEWFRACKGGEPAGANFDFAGMVTEVVLLGNVALRTGKKLDWNGTNMRITNVTEANDHLRREYRQGWTL